MTTPAINVNTTLESTQGYYRHNSCGGYTNELFTNGVNKRLQENRPASVNHPRNRYSGWRAPGAWSHTKIVDNPAPHCTLTRTQADPSSGCSQGVHQIYVNGYGWTLAGSSLPAFPSFMEGSAVSKALLKLKNQRPNLGVAFAERKQTADLFSSNVKKIAQQIRTFKHEHPKDWMQVLAARGAIHPKYGGEIRKRLNKREFRKLRVIPNRFLELQYGWKPLLSDIDDSCRALSHRDQDANRYNVHVVGTSGYGDKLSWRKITNLTTFYGYDVVDVRKYACKVVLYYRLRNPVLATFSSLGLTNPALILWEKAKFSFVLDWVLPVGNWLNTLDADFGWDFLSGTCSKMTRLTATSNFRATGLLSGDIRVSLSGDTYAAQGFGMTRTVYASAPWAGLPRFKNPFSGQHVANAVALLAQAFRR